MDAVLDPTWEYATSSAIRTTLYDVIGAIQDEAGPADDELVVASVIHLLRSGRITFLRPAEALAGLELEATGRLYS
jgi:hypothetical protein